MINEDEPFAGFDSWMAKMYDWGIMYFIPIQSVL